MAQKKRRRRLKKKVKRFLWGILFTILAVIVAFVAINYIDFSRPVDNGVPLTQFLSDLEYDSDMPVECHGIVCENGAILGEQYCDEEVKCLLAEEEYTGVCVRLLIPQGRSNTIEIYAVTRKGMQFVIHNKVW